MSEEFYRTRRLPPYVFAEGHAMKAAARARGKDIIDLGMGDSACTPSPNVVDKLAQVARNRGYPICKRYLDARGVTAPVDRRATSA